MGTKRKPARTGDGRPACQFCGTEVRASEPGVWREVRGWVQNRSQGGANAVAMSTPTGKVGCAPCMALVQRGIDPAHAPEQQALL